MEVLNYKERRLGSDDILYGSSSTSCTVLCTTSMWDDVAWHWISTLK